MKWAALPFVCLAALLVALAGGGQGAEPSRAVEVTLDEFTLTASTARVAAGTVSFTTRNTGRIDHELLVLRTELEPEQVGNPAFAGVHVLGQAHGHFAAVLESKLRSRHVRPGGPARTEKVTLKPGRYLIYCGLPKHLEQGQRASLVVG